MLAANFGQWPWDRYDALPLADPDAVSDADVDAAFDIRARNNVNRAEFRQRVADVRDELGVFLREIPVNASLSDPGLDLAAIRPAVVGLLDRMTRVGGMKLANATKIVFRHRPRLLPILDSVVRDYYGFSISLRDEELFLRIGTMGWGDYAFVLMEEMRRDLLAVGDQLARVRTALSGTSYAGMSDLRMLESLVWYYYAGR
jgi:hypothetical protein